MRYLPYLNQRSEARYEFAGAYDSALISPLMPLMPARPRETTRYIAASARRARTPSRKVQIRCLRP